MSARRAGQALKESARSIAPPPPFLQKTYDMVDNPETDSIISWGPDGTSFIVWKTAEFARDILPEHFKHNNFSSFVRQLNTYGFRKIDPDRWEFANDYFVRGNRDMLGEIHRRKPTSSAGDGRPAHRDAGALSAVELGAYGGLKAEVEQLKRDKKVLVEEVVRLRQAQLSSEAAMHTMQHRLGATEARQQQMISFLAKAMQHPAILAQFPGAGPTIHRIDDGRRRKKRRGRSGVRAVAADHESESETSDGETGSPFGSTGNLQGGDRRMIVHARGSSGAAGPSQNAGGSLGDLAQAFMQLMNGASTPQGPATGGGSSGAKGVPPASDDAHTSAGGYHPSSWAPNQHLGSVPIVESEPANSRSATDQKTTARDHVTYPAGFVPLMSEGPTITEVGHEPITELPALDNFSLDDLDFGGLSELDKDLLGSTGAADPAALWHAGMGAGASPVAVEIPETSPPSFAMPDFSDLTPIMSEPRKL